MDATRVLLVLSLLVISLDLSILPVHCLNLTQLVVPKYADRGSSVNLTCKFDLDGRKLYSVKWYKDEFEFFTYMPDQKPQRKDHRVPGVTLNWNHSGMNTVVLKDLTFNASGNYSCEVSSEAPAYLTDVRKSRMTVIAFPKKDPELEGMKPSYEEGDYINVNCTAAPSHPPPEVDWYINGVVAGPWLVQKSLPVYSAENDAFTRSIMLTLLAQKPNFSGPNSALEIKCVSVVQGLEPREKTAYLQLAGALNNQKLAQERHGSSAGHTGSTAIVWLVALALLT
uniref:Ig-like domain-containing protein n=1 Tax=Clastoptera arizonana TaxID=38151 RepID=A0A1B6BWQ5_9HEMI